MKVFIPGRNLVTLEGIEIKGETLHPRYIADLRRRIHTGDFQRNIDELSFDLEKDYQLWLKEDETRAKEDG